jgi:hypothetical protein|tara:strand:+ start:203 stop:469 length:267 start_codon:yes stop_codon:yes gene_type:complete
MKTEYDQVKAILKRHNSLDMDIDDLDMGGELYDDLYTYFQADMPYGIQKARTGMPDEWIAERLIDLKLVSDQIAENDYREDYAQRKAY